MSESELMEAAERFRRANDECAGAGCANYCCSWPGRFNEDVTTLADAFLAEHPVGEAEPVTLDRLAGLGWSRRKASPGLSDYAILAVGGYELGWYRDGWLNVQQGDSPGDWSNAREVDIPCRNLGELRTILKLLGGK